MKQWILIIALLTCSLVAYPQKFRFNKKLNAYCVKSTKEFEKIPADRKLILDKMATELAQKKGIVFTCYTNTRRTQLLQTWSQTAFYYYNIYNKTAFSYGDVISEVAPPVINVLKESGFEFSESNTKPKMWVIYIGEENEGYVIYPKLIDTYKDENDNVVVSICVEGEPTSNVNEGAFSLPYVSPRPYEGTPEETSRYEELNKQISIEMLYLAEKTREIVDNQNK